MDDASPRLTQVSRIVLGLLALLGEATPYQLKQLAASSVANLWSLQHAQLYSEPERLARAGYVSETRESGGRRRRRYALTDRGRAALATWLEAPTSDAPQIRDAGLLQLFFGADPPAVAAAQLEHHRATLREFEQLAGKLAGDPAVPDGPRLALQAGIGHEHEWIRFWTGLLS